MKQQVNGNMKRQVNGNMKQQVNARAKRQRNYRKLLLAKKSELSSNLRTKVATLAGPDGRGSEEDLAAVFAEQFTSLRINRLDYVQLKLIDAALARIDSKGYGVCLECEDPISRARLDAIPWAVRCLACQELASESDPGLANNSPQFDKASS